VQESAGNGETFLFDCGSGVVSNYVAMDVPWSRMSKVFLTHLHGDHTSDLTHEYCFGPQGDRKFPLYVWGVAELRPNPHGIDQAPAVARQASAHTRQPGCQTRN